MKTSITIMIIVFVSFCTQMINFFPWWSFSVPIFLLGIVLPLEKWKISPFVLGFAAGFLVWFFSTLYFETVYKGEVMSKVSKIISVPNYVLYLIIGFIGGILAGLSFYSGFLLRKGGEEPHLTY